MRAVLLLVFLVFTSVVSEAQERVHLGGWVLPEGSVVTQGGTQNWAAVMRFADGTVVRVPEVAYDSARMTITGVAGGQLMEAERQYIRRRRIRETYNDGTLVGSHERVSPLEGQTVRIARTEGGWVRTLVDAVPDEEQASALSGYINLDDAEYPEHPVKVGERWDVDNATIAAIYGPLAPDHVHRLEVRLDSLGRYGGGPAAFLSQTVDVALQFDDGGRVTMEMDAQIIRRLDWRLDVVTSWEGLFRVEGSMSDGSAVVTEGRMRHREWQDVALP